jgi:hypothetical protein
MVAEESDRVFQQLAQAVVFFGRSLLLGAWAA